MSAPSPIVALGGNAVITAAFGGALGYAFGRRRVLTILANFYGAIFVVFGINAIARPESALSFFEWKYPEDPYSRELLDRVMVIYGARDIFMGLALFAATLFGTRKSLGATLIAASAMPAVDGLMCRVSEGGEWGHWGYVPTLAIVGALLMR
ncbi:hypothetical protein CGCF415_v010710 [Colletotrichum fructicola]|uniref:Integral membrane protein n=1 Tax=Colletotrichum fructicola (strain Nara gc5) TaxID=1213859 RepID=A0A7J6IPK4_COLFN|nr:uncharacterized protein CGMCC3_g3887 [Colletotrichum fructicola]KAF4478855.1 hypothetical protein CGGC5_v012040 [Colletotrichum fructicola Nara gc5]KAE9580093.1 hypothetical protein CGMCC3_g3887 [Colletotrichum fructicola]KAF4434002.1 hypothetical protein CFRS1_v010576 [Colletotrichum fructicola]KAF4889969.1 hypothetical protein CGCFRS4_v009064 [Colletotrichum fructicola]KAF4898677.1 hypothetical protein CGCF415_v010710 [Colletotrichum fructicola]